MNESTPLIDSLEIKDYSAQHREQWGLIGEKSAIRTIDPEDRIDVQRVFDIDRQKGVLEFSYGEPKNERESIDWANEEVHMFAVSGSEGVSKEEFGELQGWIWFYKDEELRLKQVRESGLVELPADVEVL